MKRFQLFELTDLSWWPESFRSLLTDFLELLLSKAKPFSPRAELLAHIMEKTQQTQFVDLCSGSGGPWLSLSQDVRRVSGKDISVLLTDRYPNPEAPSQLGDVPGLSYSPHSVSALAVPSALRGIRTMFNGFHHFPPDAAALILKDAVRNNQPIAIFEMLRRSWFDLFCFLLTPINVLLLTPWVRPRTMTRLMLTYVIPIAPFIIAWDSVVSILRCYTPEELLEIAHQTNAKHYVWKAGCDRHKGLPVTYLVGYPAEG